MKTTIQILALMVLTIGSVWAEEEKFWKNQGFESENFAGLFSRGNFTLGSVFHSEDTSKSKMFEFGLLTSTKDQWVLRIIDTEDLTLDNNSIIQDGLAVSILYKDYFAEQEGKYRAYALYFISGLGYAEYTKLNGFGDQFLEPENPYDKSGIIVAFGVGMDWFFLDPFIFGIELGAGTNGRMTEDGILAHARFRF